MNITTAIKQGILHIKVKPNAKKTEVTSIDPDGKIQMTVAAPPEDNKANIEVLKFFTRELKKKMKLIRGATSKEKVLRIVE